MITFKVILYITIVAIVFIAAITVSKKLTSKFIEKTNKQIAENNEALIVAEVKSEVFEKQKEEVIESVAELKLEVNDQITDAVTQIQPEVADTVEEAKENIIKKTRRRRKPAAKKNK